MKHLQITLPHRIFFFAMMGLLALACSPTDDTADVAKTTFTVQLKALYDGAPLERYKLYPYSDYQVQFTRFQTYISDITLLNGSKATKISDINFVNFTPDNQSGNVAPTVSVNLSDVPEGAYTGMQIGFGVRPDLNAKKPTDFSASHPLAMENEYWLGWKSYIFTKVEGNAFVTSTTRPEFPLMYHLGSDPVYRTYTFNTPIHVHTNATCVVEMDLKKLFTMQGQWFDLKNTDNRATSHVAGNITLATVLANNLGNATVVK